MTMLIHELALVAESPLAWIAIAVLAAFALWQLWHWYRCPLLVDRAGVDRETAQAALDAPLADGPRFFLAMIAGIALTLTGLSFIAGGIYPVTAFYLLLAGVFVIQTEPARRQLREAELRVIAAQLLDPAEQEHALARLRSSHVWLVTLNFILLGVAALALLAV